MQTPDTNQLPEAARMCARVSANLVEIVSYLIGTYVGFVLISVLFGYEAPLPFSDSRVPDWFSATVSISLWVFLVVVIETLMISRSGASLGKKLFNIRVVSDSPDQRLISKRRALGRALFKAVVWHPAMLFSYLLLVIPMWMGDVYSWPEWLEAIIFFPSALLIIVVQAVGTVGMFRKRRKGVHDIIFGTVVTKSRD